MKWILNFKTFESNVFKHKVRKTDNNEWGVYNVADFCVFSSPSKKLAEDEAKEREDNYSSDTVNIDMPSMFQDNNQEILTADLSAESVA